jgi:hypothetical protein
MDVIDRGSWDILFPGGLDEAGRKTKETGIRNFHHFSGTENMAAAK